MSSSLDWTDLDSKAVDIARALAMDSVESAGSGHPGTAMSLAPVAHLLFSRHLRHDPMDPQWAGRDRFVLSCGHSSITLYTQLYLNGYGLTLEDLAHLRQWGSLTPGHPEHGHTAGVETTTGPLGQGVGNAVGMAMAARRERGLLDPKAAEGASVFDHHIYCIASDGDLEEGVSAEASSLAGTQQLGNLTLIWDDNHISIDDDTSVAFNEDVSARYAAYGWHTQFVSWIKDDGSYEENVAALDKALKKARGTTDKPSFIALRTIIGWPAPTKQGTGKVHGSALGAEEITKTKKILGLPDEAFWVPEDVLAYTRQAIDRGRDLQQSWQQDYDGWAKNNPDGKALHDRLATRTLPAGWTEALPTWEPGKKVATRKASGKVLTDIASVLPELWGGSADLNESNNTAPAGEPSFLPMSAQSDEWSGGPYGRVLHWGIREHAMGSTMNGIAYDGIFRPSGATFLVFADYCRPALRLAALSHLPVIYIFTHDSVAVGEDGPTHEPVETIPGLRVIPNFDVIRPADPEETAGAFVAALDRTDGPTLLALTRQAVPLLTQIPVKTRREGVLKGGYIAKKETGPLDLILLSAGSELQHALEAAKTLGAGTRVVSMPCFSRFDRQSAEYREEILPKACRRRVAIEATVSSTWGRYVGLDGIALGIDRFGMSAPGATVMKELGMTAEHVLEAVKKLS